MQKDKNQIFEQKKNLKGFDFISTGTSFQTVKNLPFFANFSVGNVFGFSIHILTMYALWLVE